MLGSDRDSDGSHYCQMFKKIEYEDVVGCVSS
jgi:hypothetical protein